MSDSLTQETPDRLAQLSAEQRRALLQQLVRTRGRGADGAIPRRAVEGPAPLSFAQRRLWTAYQLDPDSPAYNMVQTLRITGPLDVAALRAAFTELARRHDILRMSFHAGPGGEPVQRAHPPTPVPLAVVDLSGTGAAASRARALAAAQALRPFALDRPLLRAALFRVDGGEHVLSWGVHHIASDGWSQRLLLDELAALYAAFAAGAQPALPEPQVRYVDYAAWQRDRMRGETLERHTAWWRARMAGAPPLLELSAGRPDAPGAGDLAGRRAFTLSDALAEELRALARREGATLYMVLLAGWKALLSRYAGTTDVVVGIPVGGRDRVELEGVAGLIANMLPLRTDLSGDPSFVELVQRVREGTLESTRHQDLPLEGLVEALGAEHAPRVQLMFGSQRDGGTGAADASSAFSGLRVESVGEGARHTPFALDFQFTERGRQVAGTLTFQRALFDGPTAGRMLEHFHRLLAAAAEDPARRLSRLPLLSPAEWTREVHGTNGTARPLPSASVHALFAEQAARTPDAAAVVHGGEALTYGELDARAGRLAAWLVARGTGREARVGVLMERGAPMIVAFLAILRAGAAYLPLDPAAPPERLRDILDDAGASLVLTDADRAALLPEDGRAAVLDDAFFAALPADGVSVDADPDALAYVIYTSGSTGRPKGVAIPHRGIVRLVRDTDYVALGPDARIAQLSSAAFDAATFEIWGALLNGGAVVVIDRDVSLSPAALAEALRRERITALFLTTALFNRVAREEPDAFSSLEHLLFGGEAVDPAAVAQVLHAGGPGRLLHVYGPTESTTFASWQVVDGADEAAATIPIGKPVANTTLYVLDGGMQPVPAGVPGELYVGGAGLGRGYLGRPALTAERFVPHPFGGAGERLYRTGDRVRRDAEGALEFLGRYDFQVKVRGFRIEPGEIEAALLREPGVREAVVVVRGEDADRRLVAYVGTEAGAAPAPAELTAALAARLPAYMVPSALVLLPALPLNASGKVDRAALPEPAEDAGAYVAPRTPVEEVLCGIWAEVLRRERVGVDDDFFQLGGHSLVATQIVSRIRRVLAAEVPLRALFESPTVAGLAGRVEEILRGDPGQAPPPLERMVRDGPPPLSFAQQRLWLVDRLEPGGAAYNMPYALRLRGAVDAAALECAFGELARRHEPLRTRFPALDGQPVQVVGAPGPVPLPRVDLSGLAPAAREAQARRLATDEALRPFSLERGPLIRTTLLRLAADEHVLLATLHHVVSDGWSMEVMGRELAALYDAFRQGRPSPLPPLPVQYADYAAWQRAWLSGDALQRQLDWWRERLRGAPPLLEIPTDRPRAPGLGARAGSCALELPAELTRALRALGRREGATLFMVLLAAWQALLSRYSGQDDVCVGTPIAGRTRVELEGLIGFFVNTLVLRARLDGDPSFGTLLGRVREATLGAYQHQELPFERLVEDVAAERTLAHAPLFQVMFALVRDAGYGAPLLPGVRAEGFTEGGTVAKFDLDLTAVESGDAVRLVLQYRTALFDGETAAGMLRHFQTVLEGAAAHPGRPLSHLPLLRGAERARVLEAWNATDAGFPFLPAHQAFAAQAARTPGAVAVVHGAESLTYGQLRARAGEVTARLRARGVGAEARVGICLERSPDLVAAVLGVLGAGAAYLPLDPSYPPERLAYMLADSAAPLVVARHAQLDRLGGYRGGVLLLDGGAEPAEPAPPADVAPESLAYVIYTSGSTGRPKGVQVTHGGLSNYLAWAADAYAAPGRGAPLHSSLSFDLTVTSLFVPLLRGEAVHLAADEDGAAGLTALLSGGPGFTLVKLTPAHLALLAEQLGGAGAAGAAHTLVVGGEALPAETAAWWRAAAPHTTLVNEYGPTETVVGCCVHRLGPESAPPAGAVPIGRPIANTRLYVLDAAGHPAPPGVPGELYVGGAGVARGYLGRPGRTAAAFVPDPFGPVPGARLYRTGDRARWRPDGELDFLGRVDGQVKIRGFRIEPGEVEAVLRELPGVRDAAVVVREDAPGDRRLVAYAVMDGLAAGVREQLAARLPAYMVPAAVVALDALPLTPNGKVDRRALPAPEQAAGDGVTPPRTATEQLLAELWREVLRLDAGTPLGVQSHFFEMGGHSLLATQVIASVRQATGVELPLRVVFEAPTLGGLAERIDGEARAGEWGAGGLDDLSAQAAAGGASPLVAIQPAGLARPLFFVHPTGGSVHCYFGLGRRLGAGQPFHGLQSRGFSPGEAPLRTVEEMAREYLEQVRRVQPAGPYRLGGWSMGGVVAYEMARCLHAAGHEVQALLLVDAPVPQAGHPDDEESVLRGFARNLGLPAGGYGADAETGVPAVLDAARRAGLLPDTVEPAAFRRIFDVFRANFLALLRFRPEPYPGGLTLLRAARGHAPEAPATLGWDRLARGGVEVRTVEGDHFSMVREPHVGSLAAGIAAVLSR